MNLVARIPKALPWAGIGLRLRRVRPERCPWAACVFGACAQGVAQAESSREEKTVWRSPASCFSAASRSGHRRNRPYTVRQVTSTRVGSSGLKRRLRLTSLYKRKNRLVSLTFLHGKPARVPPHSYRHELGERPSLEEPPASIALRFLPESSLTMMRCRGRTILG